MIQRKLVQQGAATLMVSLPSAWCKAHQLSKGSVVNLAADATELVIHPGAADDFTETTIDLAGLAEAATRTAVVNAYRAGYDRITIRWQGTEQGAVIERIVTDYLLGFDIASRSEKSCVLESITEPSPEQFEAIVRKILYATSLFIEETLERVQHGTQFPHRESSLKISRYDNFCRRVLTRQHGVQKESFLWAFLTLIIHGQRELYHLNRLLDEGKSKPFLTPLAKPLAASFAELQRAYGERSIAILEKIRTEERTAYDTGYRALRSGRGDAAVTYHLLAALRQFSHATSPLVGILIDAQKA